MFDSLKKLFGTRSEPEEGADVPTIIEQIRKLEGKNDIALGRRIHSFQYKQYQLDLDRDISKNYRVTVYQGRERIYSFSLFANQGNYDILEQAYKRIIDFLDGDQKLSNLPDNDMLKGFFYGH
jgi:hypothetical protein